MSELCECEKAILKLLRRQKRGFNEICRLLPQFTRKIIAINLICLEHGKRVASNLDQLSFETDKRWVRQYRLVKKCQRKASSTS